MLPTWALCAPHVDPRCSPHGALCSPDGSTWKHRGSRGEHGVWVGRCKREGLWRKPVVRTCRPLWPIGVVPGEGWVRSHQGEAVRRPQSLPSGGCAAGAWPPPARMAGRGWPGRREGQIHEGLDWQGGAVGMGGRGVCLLLPLPLALWDPHVLSPCGHPMLRRATAVTKGVCGLCASTGRAGRKSLGGRSARGLPTSPPCVSPASSVPPRRRSWAAEAANLMPSGAGPATERRGAGQVGPAPAGRKGAAAAALPTGTHIRFPRKAGRQLDVCRPPCHPAVTLMTTGPSSSSRQRAREAGERKGREAPAGPCGVGRGAEPRTPRCGGPGLGGSAGPS